MSAIAVGVGVAAAVAGAAVSAAMKPKAPKPGVFTPVDFQAEQQKAIQGNLFALPQIEDLASRTNQFNISEVNKALGTTDPFQNQISTQLSKNRLDWSKGVMSKDLADQVQLLSASRAVSGGYGGTGAHNALLARNYGLTSFELQKQAESSEESWLRTAASIYEPGMFNVSSMFVTPGQDVSQKTSERDKSLTYQNAANQYQFVNDPWNQFQNQLANQTGNFLSKGITYGAGKTFSPFGASSGDWAGEAGKATSWR